MIWSVFWRQTSMMIYDLLAQYGRANILFSIEINLKRLFYTHTHYTFMDIQHSVVYCSSSPVHVYRMAGQNGRPCTFTMNKIAWKVYCGELPMHRDYNVVDDSLWRAMHRAKVEELSFVRTGTHWISQSEVLKWMLRLIIISRLLLYIFH